MDNDQKRKLSRELFTIMRRTDGLAKNGQTSDENNEDRSNSYLEDRKDLLNAVIFLSFGFFLLPISIILGIWALDVEAVDIQRHLMIASIVMTLTATLGAERGLNHLKKMRARENTTYPNMGTSV